MRTIFFIYRKLVFMFSFDFVLSENNLKIISTQLSEKWKMLILSNTSLVNSVQRLHKAPYRNTLWQRVVTRLKHVPPTWHIPD